MVIANNMHQVDRRPFFKEETMLVLSRKPGEQIVIGDKIRVTIVEVRGNRVRIGIEAPDDVAIFRAELHDWIDISPGTTDPASHPVLGKTLDAGIVNLE
jgi:carbon storage regulator